MENPNKSTTYDVRFSEFAATCLRQMSAFQYDDELIDVTFNFEDNKESISAHRVVLAAASPYFRALFSTTKGKETEIGFERIDSEIFKLLVNFCYTGVIAPGKSNVRQLLTVASLLQLDAAVEECTIFLINELACDTFREIETFAFKNKCIQLRNAVIKFGVDHFRELSLHKEFLKLCPFVLKELIEHDELKMKSEEEVFNAVFLWYSHNTVERRQHIANIVGSLRITELLPTFILKFIKPLPGCEQLALNAMDWFHVPESRQKSLLRYTTPRSVNTYLIAVQVNREPNKSVLRYDAAQKRWLLLREFLIMRRFFNVIYSNKRLIFIGGRNYVDKKATNSVDCFNLETQAWESWPPMRYSRSEFCAVEFDEHIYVMGGCDDNPKGALNSMEIYDLRTHAWSLAAPMISCRRCGKAVVLGERIYVIGGFSSKGVLNGVEYYNPIDDVWERRKSMLIGRGMHGVAVANGHIYALSGWSAYGHTPTVERFDAENNEWTQVSSFALARKQICGVALNDQLMAIGGMVDSQAIDIVEEYDLMQNLWYTKSPLPKAGEYSCVSIPTGLVDKLQKIAQYAGCGDVEDIA